MITSSLPLAALGSAVYAVVFWSLTLGRRRNLRRDALRLLAAVLLLLVLGSVMGDAVVLAAPRSSFVQAAGRTVTTIALQGARFVLGLLTCAAIVYAGIGAVGWFRLTWRRLRW